MWYFAKQLDNTLHGWNDTGVQSFRDNRLKNLAREIIQNSLDAGPINAQLPVRVQFSLEHLKRECVPGLDQIEQILGEILDNPSTKRSEGDSRVLEIVEAHEESKKTIIPVLIIEDFNTAGMPYGRSEDDDDHKPFNRYMYSEGATGDGEDRAGSHGLGKAAPLATTPLRTIFASSCWEENSTLKTVYNGRCRLMGTKQTIDGTLSRLSGTGRWGTHDFHPFEEISNDSYSWLKRDKRGSTISVPGFRLDSDEDWAAILSGYVVSEFFAAVARGTLEVTIKDNSQPKTKPFKIDMNSITKEKSFFSNASIIEEIKKYESDEKFDALENARWYYRCLSNHDKDVITVEDNLPDIGEVRLRLLVKEGAPRRICFLRKNMRITENIKAKSKQGLWSPGTTTHLIRDFVGIVEILDKGGRELFRQMEPPQHNLLSIDQMPQKLKKRGKNALGRLSSWLRENVEEYAPSGVESERIVSELGEYFHDSDNIDPDSSMVLEETDPNSKFTIKLKPLKVKKLITTVEDLEEKDLEGDEGGGRDVKGKGKGGTGSSGQETGQGKGGTGNKTYEPNGKIVNLAHQRIVGKKSDFIIHLRVKEPFDGEILLYDIGIDVKLLKPISSSSVGTIENGLIKVYKTDFSDNALKIDVTLEESALGGLSIIART